MNNGELSGIQNADHISIMSDAVFALQTVQMDSKTLVFLAKSQLTRETRELLQHVIQVWRSQMDFVTPHAQKDIQMDQSAMEIVQPTPTDAERPCVLLMIKAATTILMMLLAMLPPVSTMQSLKTLVILISHKLQLTSLSQIATHGEHYRDLNLTSINP